MLHGGRRVPQLQVECEFVYLAQADTPAVLQVQPRDAASVKLVHQQWSVQPQRRLGRYGDLYATYVCG